MTLEEKIKRCAAIMMRDSAKERLRLTGEDWTKETDDQLLARADGPEMNLDTMVSMKVNEAGKFVFSIRMEDSFTCAPAIGEGETLDECFQEILEALEEYVKLNP